ncbi:MAG: glutathione S-transferase N-terminal domain-containing protein [Geminicoccaceae bacterium]
MDELTLVIGNRNSSSWSLRPWLLLQHLGLPHRVVTIPLRRPDTAARIHRHSPAGKVPVLRVGELAVWDSLAIAEWLAERHPELWPADPAQRALARSVSCEMHSGFSALRTFLPMDFTARFGPPGKLLASVEADIERIVAIWASCRRAAAGAGPFLFGRFGIADAMFAPVCSRFTTYAVPLERAAQAYVDTVMAMSPMQEWGRLAHAEVAGLPLTEERESVAAPSGPMSSAAPATPSPSPPPLVAPPPPQRPAVTIAPLPLPQAPPTRSLQPASEAAPLPTTAAPRPVEPLPVELREAPPIERVLPPRPAERRETRLPEPVPAASQAVPPPRPVEPRPTPPPAPASSPVVAGPLEPPAELRRIPRPIPSTVMVKPIGDGTRRRR